MTRLHGTARSCLALAVAVLVASCASTPGNVRPTTETHHDVHFAANDEVGVRVTAASGVSMAEYEKQRLELRVREKVDAARLKARNDPARLYRVDVEVTKYDKGNAFARAMLAGLGAMQIVATVRIYALPEERKVTEFGVDKTFAWGGIYGASTNIEDVEYGFADAVAGATADSAAK